MAFNKSDPEYQRSLQKAYAKNNMGGGSGLASVIQGRVTGAHAKHQMDRKAMFGRLAEQKRMNSAQMRQWDRSHNLSKKQLKQDKKNRRFTTGFGLASMLYSGYEGNRRKNLLEAENQKQAARNLQTDNLLTSLASRKYGPGMSSGSYYKGGV